MTFPIRILGPPIDATLQIRAGMPIFPGDPRPLLRRTARIEAGAALEMSEMHLGCHVGTHIDAPAHFLAKGSLLDVYGAERLCGRVVVLDGSSAAEVVHVSDLDLSALQVGDHVVLRTANSRAAVDGPFLDNPIGVSAAAVSAILARGATVLGFDYYSLDPREDGALPAHEAAAELGVPVVVMLDLRQVSPGIYFWVVAPLRVQGVEGAPARVLFFPALFPEPGGVARAEAELSPVVDSRGMSLADTD